MTGLGIIFAILCGAFVFTYESSEQKNNEAGAMAFLTCVLALAFGVMGALP